MVYLKILLSNEKEKSWLESEGMKCSSILMILKKNLGYKNQTEILKKTDLDPAFLKIKLFWKTDQEFSEITQLLNGLVNILPHNSRVTYYTRGRYLLGYKEKGGKLEYVPYFKTQEGERSLQYFTLERTIERWIKEKF